MWPDGPPTGWPSDDAAVHPVVVPESTNTPEAQAFRLRLRALVEDGTPPEAVRKKLVELYRTLNDYSLARYGKGLTVQDFKRFVAAGVPAEVEP